MRRAGEEFDAFEFAGALQVIEDFFWADLCDNYLELIKARAYSADWTPGKRSALATLKTALSAQLRLFAPYLPFITEEIWSWLFATPLGFAFDSANLEEYFDRCAIWIFFWQGHVSEFFYVRP